MFFVKIKILIFPLLSHKSKKAKERTNRCPNTFWTTYNIYKYFNEYLFNFYQNSYYVLYYSLSKSMRIYNRLAQVNMIYLQIYLCMFQSSLKAKYCAICACIRPHAHTRLQQTMITFRKLLQNSVGAVCFRIVTGSVSGRTG